MSFFIRWPLAPVRLPQLLAQSALTPPEVTQVQKLLGDFLRFMQKNHAQFFVQEYEDEGPVSGPPSLPRTRSRVNIL